MILQRSTGLEQLSVNEVCRAIFSISALAFVAGGMNVLYHIERLPLMWAILIHGVVLYFAYLATYQINHWLQTGMKPLVIFTVIFVLGYLAVWAIIYSVTKKNTEKLNEALKEKQQN